ncbi:lipase member H-like isoform X2 [Neocloeon triangulifer]|uniref:lipase member H-like isoform X2 n=1 Tax=Neocloeon triangulifer TaxID=2078957 RepID=UPI00286F6C56|nr:lipase member H-like isoform X2 [Neocloeon triangulifer]
MACLLQVLLVTFGLVLWVDAGFITNALCAVTRSLGRSIDVGGIYLRSFPLGRCNPVNFNDVFFKAYPRKSSINTPHQLLTLEDDPDELRSLFNASLPTAIYTHGFLEGEKGTSIRAFRAAFLYRGDYNFIAVDWQKLAAGPWYLSAANNVRPVGMALAQLIDRLVNIKAIRLDTLHLIGFSLGAHVTAVAAKYMTVGRVPRITGLDPAYPLFTSRPKADKLDPSDAEFVDVIHTCGGLYGYSQPLGHVDFYPNGGSFFQPGCANVISFGTCSHWRSWRFFEESLRGGEFIGTKCTSYDDFLNARCKYNQRNPMGIHTNMTARGNFYLRTNWAAPFSVF